MADEEIKKVEEAVVEAAPKETPVAETPAAEEKPVATEGKPAATEEQAAPAGDKKEQKRDIFAEILGEEAADKVKIIKAKQNKNIQRGIVHVQATFNNTIVSVTDTRGNSIGWSSAGKMGFKGSRKSTAYAAQVVSQDACRQAMSHGLKEVDVRVKGPGSGRESAVRAVGSLGLEIHTVDDVTPVPHNGCRPKKARRV